MSDWPPYLPEDEKGNIFPVKCHFIEYDSTGNMDMECWFKASPEICPICLRGKLIDEIQYISSKLDDIKKKV